METDTPAAPRTCSQSKCKRVAAAGRSTCDTYRENNTRARQESRKWKRKKEAEAGEKRSRKNNTLDAVREEPQEPEDGTESGDERDEAKINGKHVEFRGTYQTPEDPLITDKERVQMTIYEIWKVMGYRFRYVHHKNTSKIQFLTSGETGHRTRLWCCQDKDRKQKARPSTREGAKPQDTLGMHRIFLRHHDSHVHYYDVAMPPEAAAIIREGVASCTLVQMVGRVQALFPQVTANQIHSAWSVMSEILWKRDKMQLPLAKILLKEFGDDVDVLDIHPAEGIEQLAWVMKKVMEPLRRKIVEIGIDATSSSIDIGKRKTVLEAWAQVLRDKYGVIPVFVHVDKDMAEIGMVRSMWDAKIQLCLWHLKRARKLSTTPYNVHRAHAKYIFIDLTFKPAGRADPTEYEGGILDAPMLSVDLTPVLRPHAVTIRLPPTQTRSSVLTDMTNLPSPANNAPPLSTGVDDESDVEDNKRTFCPPELRESIITLMERHLNAHPLIPGYAHPSAEGIREWAVRQMYCFCRDNDLREAWAYLWENWYRRGRWELWAQAEHPEISRLKTTMMVESHWHRIKHDFLHHFHKPRLDLLAWIVVVKLAPQYYRRLKLLMEYTGWSRFSELPSWRKDFKSEWRRPDPYRWVCTCPYFFRSRFLICKHLVQAVHPVDPIFFLEVNRRSASTGSDSSPITAVTATSAHRHAQNEGAGYDSDEELTEVRAERQCRTFDERLTSHLRKIRDFCDGMEYQHQFQDSHMLDTLEREGAGFFGLIDECLTREHCVNSTRSQAPTTWDPSTANAMFYCTRPVPSDRDT
ncbi:hypothetical protein DFH07DRAFT_865834 [Mycena maculata]|uniref:SWIM-type domain-containing protein n=1 Tax=Mycena maculata TaxID=230809 RepID=A0AAD7JYC4_9AGAR|nr:hypothetical protein DFH07DRAFT_865834 [Mycena maculata]